VHTVADVHVYTGLPVSTLEKESVISVTPLFTDYTIQYLRTMPSLDEGVEPSIFSDVCVLDWDGVLTQSDYSQLSKPLC